MKSIVGKASELPGPVLLRMFQARKREFVDRLKWVDGDGSSMETDDYDTTKTTYFVVEQNGEHMASARTGPLFPRSLTRCNFVVAWANLRVKVPVDYGSMHDWCETTRLVVESKRGSREAGKMLAAAGMDWLARSKYTASVGLFYPQMLVFYKRVGWMPDVIGDPDKNGVRAGLWRL